MKYHFVLLIILSIELNVSVILDNVDKLNQNIEKYKSSTRNQLTFKYEKKAYN